MSKISSDPTDRNCYVGPTPNDDRDYFEQMTKSVFQSGFSWKVIESKWPNFEAAFAAFDVEKVAAFDGRDLERLGDDAGIVRNIRKIEATVSNAREMMLIKHEFGSFSAYLAELAKDGEVKMCKTLSKRFSHLGSATSMFFLRKVGFEMPESIKKWHESRSKSA